MKLIYGLLLAAVAAAHAASPARTNVLFLVADDLNCDLGCYGERTVQTPNIDRLAARGVRFERAYCQFPLCSPSRSSFLTGRLPDATGVVSNPSARRPYSPHFREKLPDTVTLPQLFKNQGWYAVRIGKLYHYGVPLHIGTASLDDYPSWDFTVNPRGCDRDDLDRVFSLQPGQFGGTLSWFAHPKDDRAHTDGMSADEAVRALEQFQQSGRAFFLAVGFYRPHTPYVAPQKYFKRYPPNKIALPALSEQDRARQPGPAYATANRLQDAMLEPQRREAIQAYWASITFMDAQVGRVLDALRRFGLSRNTIVVFTSDHGYHLADHGLWQKRSLFERSARVPLIVAAPGAKGNGKAAPGVVELLDLYPTLAGLCGLSAPDYLDGVSLAKTLEDPAHRARTVAYTQVDRGMVAGRSVRTERWRYTEWDDGRRGKELYDYETDPAETRNLAEQNPRQVEEMSALLAKYRRLQ